MGFDGGVVSIAGGTEFVALSIRPAA